ncbi:extracellular solute-binding protein [Paucibacter sp. Y2R2-4]|uniref:extracellular solute-binding protein n=1 Tax=Paucibacter sp. Y2R2-4 TaxID=2893553 RepID=UPI0021E4D9CF|nr:extracellular solute-binding protein [Paucibacter sp. Y2R2-4]MCV2350490.1 extracellular solute-binding protein [Paucibacter sp. Y2R2-4]
MSTALASVAAPAWAAEGTRLRVLAWPGYAEPEVVKRFEQRSGAQVALTVIDSDVDLWQKMTARQGRDFDVFAVNTAELRRYVRQDLLAEIKPSLIPNLAKQLPRFRSGSALAGLSVDGSRYGVPFTFAEMGLIYDRSRVQEAPDSIAALWDPRYRGRVIAYNGGTHNFTLAAQSLGLPKPFELSVQQWRASIERLIALRRNAGGFYTRPEESVALFKRRQAALMLANFGRQQLLQLRAAGVDAAYAIPKEGALAWLDCWVITRQAQDSQLAHAWINHVLEDEASRLLGSRQGLGNTTLESSDYRAEDKLIWLEPVESEERRNQLWARIISGDRAAKVLES